MGSADLHSKQMAEPTEKKSIKNILKSLFHNKKKNKKDDAKKTVEDRKHDNKEDEITEKLSKLDIDKEEDDEFLNFERKVIVDEGRVERIDSHSSEDSGFVDIKGDVVEELEELSLKDGDKKEGRKEKKLQTVTGARGPVRSRHNDYSTHPYHVTHGNTENSYKQISLNTQALSGGHVIVNTTQPVECYTEVDAACDLVKEISSHSLNEQDYWKDVLELINEETNTATLLQDLEDPLSDFQVDTTENYAIPIMAQEFEVPNPIDMFTNQHNYEDTQEMSNIFDNSVQGFKSPIDSIFLTPPHSENVSSPLSGSPGSYNPQNSEYTLSPERASPVYNSDYEVYQEIPEEIPEKPRGRTVSLSSMTMKQFKDLQKEIGTNFSKMECCQADKRSCKEFFAEHLSKLKMVERKNLCLKVSKLDLKTAYGILHHVLLSLARGEERESVQFALFGLICERVMPQKPSPFLGEFGLGLLKAASLRCPQHPVLTRYLVQCVRAALREEPALCVGKECVFHEVDTRGDHLLSACARAGDQNALVLAALLSSEPSQPPLFRIHHANSDGYSALHVACSEHRADSPRLHTVHVLLEHGQADLWKGDIKGGDTAVHLAVNSPHCDLQLVMVMFRHVDRKMWKKLAHCHNMSSVTPLEYARSATKSTTRQNYPQEVLDFLKKCR